jgi:hypothetical protein
LITRLPGDAMSRYRRRSWRVWCSGCCTAEWAPSNRCVGPREGRICQIRAEGRHARAFQADARAINDKVRLYARVGTALIAGRDDKQDGYDAIIALMPWEKFCTSVAVIAWSEGKTALTPVPECPDMMPGSKAHLYTSGVLTMADH